MLNEKIKNIQLSAYEFVIISAFIALGYCLLYKYSFYKALEIPWFITNLTPQFLFFSSFKVLFVGIASFLAGYLLGFIGSSIKVIKNIFYIHIFFLLVLGALYTYQRLNNNFFDLPILNLSFQDFFSVYLVFASGYSFRTAQNLEKISNMIISTNKKRSYKKYIILFLVTFGIYILIPLSLGDIAAKNILDNKEANLNKVLLKDSSKDWYLIESMGDKVLLIDKKNNIKIVEYKELDFIQTEKTK